MAGAAALAQDRSSVRPNVIWLIADQHRGQALGINGDPNAHTPYLDNMSRLGINFTQARAGFPLCCPFRGSMLTGRYPHHMVPGHEYPLPEGQPTLTQPFREAGYQTAYFGKWHLDGFHESEGRAAMHIVPPNRRGGFDTWIGYENNNSPWDSWVHGGSGKDAFHYRLPNYETAALSDLLIKYIRERAGDQNGRPFFAVLSIQPPHDPYVAPADFQQRYNGAQLTLRHNVPEVRRIQETARRDLEGYYAAIEAWDANIGRIRKALNETNLAFNTHLMVFSDHGDLHGSHGQFRKTSPYEESCRIPMILSGEVPHYDGRLIGRPNALFDSVDIAPTTLGLCGVKPPAWMEGHDLSGYRLQGHSRPDPDSTYLQLVIPSGHPDSVNKPYRGLVTRDGWKYVCFEGNSWMMFNLNEDPYEEANLANNNAFRAERKKLIERLRQWVADTGDKFTIPDN